MGARRFGALAAFAIGLGLLFPAAAKTPHGPPTVEIRQAGDLGVVFRHATDACEAEDIPDTYARAFRDATDTVTVFATHWRNRRLRGLSLTALKRDCAVVLEGAGDAGPERHDDRLWIASTWTADGATVFGLVHGEYQGHRHPGQCPSKVYSECWYNVISQAVSRDGGRGFDFERKPPPVVAAVPYRYDAGARRRIGFFEPSNILRDGDAWYTMVFTEAVGAQKRGVCLLRTADISDPDAWRAWDGQRFGVRLLDPYRSGDPRPGEHVCEPVGRGVLDASVGSLVRHEPSGAYIAVMVAMRRDAPGAPMRRFVVASASWDLVRWSRDSVVREIPPPPRPGCDADATLLYPSLLDPDSTDRNFGMVGATAMLFMTRFNLRNCQSSLDRDLVRLPVAISVRTD